MRFNQTLAVLALGLMTVGCVGMARGTRVGASSTKDIVYIERDGFDASSTSLDIYAPRTDEKPLPVLVFIHGGGWSIGDKKAVNAKPRWANSKDWIFVSINYRLSPAVMHPEHARDAASAIAWVHEHISEFGGDPERIAIMGHSAGAHIAAILGSDESLLSEVGMEPKNLAGVVVLDGAGYDLTHQMENLPEMDLLERMFTDAFGDDKELWVSASPTLQAKIGDELPPLLAIHVASREDSQLASEGLVDAWGATGARAEIAIAEKDSHSSLNRRLGTRRDPETKIVQSFLESVFRVD